MWQVRLFFIVAASAIVMAPAASSAQGQPVPLAKLVPGLYEDFLGPEVFALAVVFPGADQAAIRESANQRLSAAFQLSALSGYQLSTFPLGSASGGFTWTFNPASGALTRASSSFGPVFAERALTIGRKRLNVGVNVQHVTFDHLNGRSLSGGEIIGYSGVPNAVGNVGIYFADSLDLRVVSDNLNMFATYGLTDRIDIGVAVPVNRVQLNATLTSRVGDTQNGIDTSQSPLVESRSGSASGIGDVVVRAKFNVLERWGGGIAESIDVRLPTGDENNLLGVPGAQVKALLIASSTMGRLSPHINFGYTVSGKSDSVDAQDSVLIAPPEELNYTGGADVALSLHSTVAFDVVGRTLRRVGSFSQAASDLGPSYPELRLNPGANLNLLLGSAGIKINPFGNMLLTANVLFPLSQNGLTAKLTWMAGIDYSF